MFTGWRPREPSGTHFGVGELQSNRARIIRIPARKRGTPHGFFAYRLVDFKCSPRIANSRWALAPVVCVRTDANAL